MALKIITLVQKDLELLIWENNWAKTIHVKQPK